MKIARKIMLLCQILMVATSSSYSLGIINTQTVATTETLKTKERLKDETTAIKQKMKIWADELDNTNKYLSQEIVELIKIKELQKAILLQNLSILQNTKKLLGEKK